ncbi:MAG: SRPBCC family protein [Conexibacter sp.]
MDEEIDIADHIGAVTRTVRRGERAGKPTQTVVAERTYETSSEDLWDAITSAERIPRWLLPISGELRLGGRYQLEGNAGGEITDCEPPRRLGVTWEYGGAVSWVDVELSAVPGGTRLELEHTAHPSPEWEAAGFGPGAVGIGWDLSLLGLALHVTSGAAIDRAQARAWQASDEAKEFMRASGDAWCDADVAGGTPAELARAAADRTAQAYTAAGG